jgi:hypothetical protein
MSFGEALLADKALLADVRRAGYVRRRLLGGYRVALKGTWYLRDVCARDEEVHSKMSKYADEWAAGGMTKRERREAKVALVLLGWKRDRIGEAEAVAELRSSGFDPIEALGDFDERLADQVAEDFEKWETKQEE